MKPDSNLHPSATSSAKSRREAEKRTKQFALLGFLAIVLIIGWMAGSSNDSQQEIDSDSTVVSLASLKRNVTVANEGEPNELMSRFANVQALPRLTAEELTAVDLFQRPLTDEPSPTIEQPAPPRNESVPEPEPESVPGPEPESVPEPEPSSRPEPEPKPTFESKPIVVGAIYGSHAGEEQSALINGRIIRSGQELKAGVRVISITPEGVHVQPTPRSEQSAGEQ